jgi:hypothetical protein
MERIIYRSMKAIMENSGAQHGTLFKVEETTGYLMVVAEYNCDSSVVVERDKINYTDDESMGVQKLNIDGDWVFSSASGIVPITVFGSPKPLLQWQNGPHSVVNYVQRTSQSAILECAYKDSQFGADSYIAKVSFFSFIGSHNTDSIPAESS